MLTMIDVFSKFAWAVPVKSKSAIDVTTAMKNVLIQGRVPKNLQTDRGKEFYNSNFKKLMEQYKINLYSIYSNLKASIYERLNRTLKNKMWIEFSLRGNFKWLDILPNLTSTYNSTKHRTIGMKPKDVTTANEAQVLTRYSNPSQPVKKPNFKVNDRVRVSRVKQVFEKGYTPNWSTEIFTIGKVSKTNPITHIYLVEKIIKARGNQVYVKWLGFDNSHNS